MTTMMMRMRMRRPKGWFFMGIFLFDPSSHPIRQLSFFQLGPSPELGEKCSQALVRDKTKRDN
jgi:hypothetical protein